MAAGGPVRVAELRDLLAAMPDNDVVLIAGHHIAYIRREHSRNEFRSASVMTRCDCGVSHPCRSLTPVPVGPAIELCTRTFHRGNKPCEPDPPVQFYGRWAKAARAVIDRQSDDPDAAP